MVDTGVCVNPHGDTGIADTHTRVGRINRSLASIHVLIGVASTRICAGGAGTFDRRSGEQCLGSKSTDEHETSENRHLTYTTTTVGAQVTSSSRFFANVVGHWLLLLYI